MAVTSRLSIRASATGKTNRDNKPRALECACKQSERVTKTMGLYSCAIGGCEEKTYRKSAGVKFFYLKNIKDEKVVKAWKDRILSTRSDIKHRWQINDVAICSRHFPDGDERNMPTIIPKPTGNKERKWPEKKERRSIIRQLQYSDSTHRSNKHASADNDNINDSHNDTSASLSLKQSLPTSNLH